jgi:mono/diheme cytochrome c family protein
MVEVRKSVVEILHAMRSQAAATCGALVVALCFAATPARAEFDAAARGAYLAAAAGCDRCHTDIENKGQPYAGGRRLKTAFGTIPTPNITPDLATGIGRWSRSDFVRAMRWGIAPDDSHYVSAFPYPFYNRLRESDLADLKTFLDGLPAVVRVSRAGADSLALVERTRDAVAMISDHFAGPWQPDPAKDAVWNRGAYLVATIGRCGDCHTPRTVLGAPDPERFLGGVAAGRGGRKVPNITPDPDTGIGKWSLNDIVDLLTTGAMPSGDFVGGGMAEIVDNTSRLNDADRRAIAVYLRDLPTEGLGKKN